MRTTTVYLHSRRTLCATWHVGGDAPCLVDYTEYAPDTAADEIASVFDSPTFVVSDPRWFVHSYPSSTEQVDSERKSFELEQVCGLSHRSVIDLECTYRLESGLYWQTLIGLLPDATDGLHVNDAAAGRVQSDVAVDLRLAMAVTGPQPHHWALHGRRGDSLITAVINPNHQPCLVLVRHAADTVPSQRTVQADLDTLSMRFGLEIGHVMLFGDFLTVSSVESLRSSLRASGIRSARLQPFRMVDTSVNEETASRILARAHVIGPVMASVLHHLP